MESTNPSLRNPAPILPSSDYDILDTTYVTYRELRTWYARWLRDVGLARESVAADNCGRQLRARGDRLGHVRKNRWHCGLRTHRYCAEREAEVRIRDHNVPEIAALSPDGYLDYFTVSFRAGVTIATIKQVGFEIRELLHDKGISYITNIQWDNESEREILRVLVFGHPVELLAELRNIVHGRVTRETFTVGGLEPALRQLFAVGLPEDAEACARLELRWKGVRLFVSSRVIGRELSIREFKQDHGPMDKSPQGSSQEIWYDEDTGEVIPRCPDCGELATWRTPPYFEEDYPGGVPEHLQIPYKPTRVRPKRPKRRPI